MHILPSHKVAYENTVWRKKSTYVVTVDSVEAETEGVCMQQCG